LEGELERIEHFLMVITFPQVKTHVARRHRYDEQVFVMSSTSPSGAHSQPA
jgi:hypothetical protein